MISETQKDENPIQIVIQDPPLHNSVVQVPRKHFFPRFHIERYNRKELFFTVCVVIVCAVLIFSILFSQRNTIKTELIILIPYNTTVTATHAPTLLFL